MRKFADIKSDSSLPHTPHYDDLFFYQHANRCFVDVDDENAMRALNLSETARHFNGAIVLRVDKDVLIDFRLWDVNIWSVFIQALLEYKSCGTTEVPFLERPVTMKWCSLGDDRMMFALHSRGQHMVERELPELEFVRTLQNNLYSVYRSLVQSGVRSRQILNTLELLSSIL